MTVLTDSKDGKTKGKEERENDWTDGRTDGRTEGREEQRGMEGDVKERGWKEEQKVTGRR